MFAVAGGPSFASSPLNWNLLFARQPEPDLEFTEEELEQTTNIRSPSPMKSPKKPGGRPLLWLLLLVLVGGGAYVYMEPEMVMDLVGPLLGESPMPPQQPPVTMKPTPPRPAPVAPAPTLPPPTQTPQAEAPTPSPGPTAAPSVPSVPALSPTTVPTSRPAPAEIAPPIVAVPNPLFGEGQRVTLLPNSAAPQDKVTLMQDAAGTKPGATIPPGTVLTVLDGDLQGDVWVYSVRSDYGTKGWVPENQLRLKP